MESYSNINVGQRIRNKRKDFKYTSFKLAELLNISPRFLSAIERGEKGMSYATLKKVCDVLCVTSDYLLFGKEESNNYIGELKIAKLLTNIDKEYFPLIENQILNFIDTINTISKIIENSKNCSNR